MVYEQSLLWQIIQFFPVFPSSTQESAQYLEIYVKKHKGQELHEALDSNSKNSHHSVKGSWTSYDKEVILTSVWTTL